MKICLVCRDNGIPGGYDNINDKLFKTVDGEYLYPKLCIAETVFTSNSI